MLPPSCTWWLNYYPELHQLADMAHYEESTRLDKLWYEENHRSRRNFVKKESVVRQNTWLFLPIPKAIWHLLYIAVYKFMACDVSPVLWAPVPT